MKKEVVEKKLLIFMLEIQAMVLANKATTRLMSVIYPGLPSSFIQNILLEKKKAFATYSSVSVTNKVYDKKRMNEAKRGNLLREFEIYLERNDPHKIFLSLKEPVMRMGMSFGSQEIENLIN